MKVLLSIKPQFADKILNGEKRFEFRKTIFRNNNVTSVIIYASSPMQKVIGEFDISEIYEMEPGALWKETANHSGISKEYFDKYFQGKMKGFAIKVGRMTKYPKPLALTDLGVKTPPQSFCYIKEQLELSI